MQESARCDVPETSASLFRETFPATLLMSAEVGAAIPRDAAVPENFIVQTGLTSEEARYG